ncbi:hypothetical protein NADFUDRAFT_47569 [Nadsonia fulvescens var. elongata DSM 6958]|uniref:AFG1-like ATPase n=1 Tax=Nadsonia fulvescens var. elongata DSM 6958 TaxID=857566 RepID=A0A1E3PGL4_9ASCO|nr:hypothetical protein NADFUDRAFT_47569 [Nadsonia fulvescens var. elongata DSM 6958]
MAMPVSFAGTKARLMSFTAASVNGGVRNSLFLGRLLASDSFLSINRGYTTSIEHNLKAESELSVASAESSLVITDPFVLYQNRVALGLLRPDEAQLRAALQFQKLYYRVKDYNPPEDFSHKVRELTELLKREIREEKENEAREALEGKQKKSGGLSILQAARARQKSTWYDTNRRSLELIRILSDEEELLNFRSPQGLLIHGEVGCGKSMLMDIFAESLPHQSKIRYHYSNFMLSIYARIHKATELRKKNPQSTNIDNLTQEYILLEIAQDLVHENTVLLLDEFMLPDMAAAKIVKTLFTYFFKLGGVLVGTSNRLPEELYATEFKKNQFLSFYAVLQARCVSYDMCSETDWREVFSAETNETNELNTKSESAFVLSPTRFARHYYIGSENIEDTDKEWKQEVKQIIPDMSKLSPNILTIYGRPFIIPHQDKEARIAMFTFDDLCGKALAAADYISLASNYETIILDQVPYLLITMKNEARRFITLLDALYESKCKLVIRSEGSPDNLFFPDMSIPGVGDRNRSSEASLLSEMYSAVHQDLSHPFRPNVSSYDSDQPADTTDTRNDPANIPNKDFTKLSAFTGEDEKFAYKRAVSRLKEMTGSDRWWSQKWAPIGDSTRLWEEFETAKPLRDVQPSISSSAYIKGLDTSLIYKDQERVFQDRPAFDEHHFWSMASWGKAGLNTKDGLTRRWLEGSHFYEQNKT